MDNRPIKGNKSGKYSVVIDPTNDITAYYNGVRDLEQLIQQYFQSLQYTPQLQLRKNASKEETFKKSNINHANRDTCSVCLIQFKDKQKIKMLECGHCFHDQCVHNWFSQQLTCPNCRFSLGQTSQNKQQQTN